MTKTVNSVTQTQIEVKKSKFISFLLPFNKFEKYRQQLKEQHPKATHIIYAYRTLNQYDQIEENSSDDNEPKGAAGGPTLAQLRGEELVNVALLTVRYFGGTKLGIGGMIRAYSSSAREVIDNSELTEYKKLFEHKICIAYNEQRQIEYHFKTLNVTSLNRDFQSDKVCYSIKVDKVTEESLRELGVVFNIQN